MTWLNEQEKDTVLQYLIGSFVDSDTVWSLVYPNTRNYEKICNSCNVLSSQPILTLVRNHMQWYMIFVDDAENSVSAFVKVKYPNDATTYKLAHVLDCTHASPYWSILGTQINYALHNRVMSAMQRYPLKGYRQLFRELNVRNQIYTVLFKNFRVNKAAASTTRCKEVTTESGLPSVVQAEFMTGYAFSSKLADERDGVIYIDCLSPEGQVVKVVILTQEDPYSVYFRDNTQPRDMANFKRQLFNYLKIEYPGFY